MKKDFIPQDLYKKIISLIPICCVDLVIKKGNSFLLVKRLENPAKNKWWVPGGRILFNETIIGAVKRKLKEEVGIHIKDSLRVESLGVKEIGFKKGKYHQPVYSIVHIFLVELLKREEINIKMDATMSSYKWFNAIQSNFDPYIKKCLKKAGF